MCFPRQKGLVGKTEGIGDREIRHFSAMDVDSAQEFWVVLGRLPETVVRKL